MVPWVSFTLCCVCTLKQIKSKTMKCILNKSRKKKQKTNKAIQLCYIPIKQTGFGGALIINHTWTEDCNGMINYLLNCFERTEDRILDFDWIGGISFNSDNHSHCSYLPLAAQKVSIGENPREIFNRTEFLSIRKF